MEQFNDLMAELVAEEKLALACKVLNKNPSDYSHLDRGRQAMTGSNLLRNAIKKDGTLLPLVLDVGRGLVALRGPDFKKESSGKSPAAPRPHTGIDPTWKTTDEDFERWAKAYEEDEKLKAQGLLPPMRKLMVSTATETMVFDEDGTVKYHWRDRKDPKSVKALNSITSR